jgi:hypothetical protein
VLKLEEWKRVKNRIEKEKEWAENENISLLKNICEILCRKYTGEDKWVKHDNTWLSEKIHKWLQVREVKEK